MTGLVQRYSGPLALIETTTDETEYVSFVKGYTEILSKRVVEFVESPETSSARTPEMSNRTKTSGKPMPHKGPFLGYIEPQTVLQRESADVALAWDF